MSVSRVKLKRCPWMLKPMRLLPCLPSVPKMEQFPKLLTAQVAEYVTVIDPSLQKGNQGSALAPRVI